jgi:hypothetical protein
MRFRFLVPWFLLLVAVSPATRAADDEELAPPPPDDELAPPPPAEEDLAPPPPAKSATPTDISAWLGVTEFRGFYECNRVNSMDRQRPPNLEQGQETSVATVKFVLTKLGGADQWVVKEATVSGSRQSTLSNDSTWHHGRSTETGTFTQAIKDLHLSIDRRTGAWRFEAGGQLPEPFQLQHTMVSRDYQNGSWQNETRQSQAPSKSYASGTIRGTVTTSKPDVLSGHWDFMKYYESNQTADDYHARVVLFPMAEDVDLVVELHGLDAKGGETPMADWRPLGTLDRKPGSFLKAAARLKTPDGKPAKAVVKKFIFRLKDTSREPGVCLNYPLHATPKAGASATADLRFAADGGKADGEQQEKEVLPKKDPNDFQFAETKIEALDWGAWADLIVQAELADGRIVTGHLDGKKDDVVMLLPEREAGSHIAAAWKKEHGITGTDLDDDEPNPSGSRGNGDGYTLYEEYRGFVENGQHIEGDPKKIDFFVRNEIGADAQPGIDLFGDTTGAVIHKKVTASEFDRKVRIMNANHDQGAHHVDQHGVVMQTIGSTDGAVAVFTQTGVRGRPGICKGIDVQPRDAETSVTTSTNLPMTDLAFAYDRAILHELLHVVGVEHHGKGDGSASFIFIPYDDRSNKTGKSHFQMLYLGGREDVTITNESTGRELAQELEGDLLLYREKVLRPTLYADELAVGQKIVADREGIADFKLTAEDWANDSINHTMGSGFSFYIGKEHGESSGDESCVMRYYFAKLYEKRGKANAYYFISKQRTEHAGMTLCKSAKGSGINDPGRKPQPRYGDAQAGYGGCGEWIVFNDSIKPEPAP